VVAPRHANTHSNLGVLLRATGHSGDAEAEYRAAIAITSMRTRTSGSCATA